MCVWTHPRSTQEQLSWNGHIERKFSCPAGTQAQGARKIPDLTSFLDRAQ